MTPGDNICFDSSTAILELRVAMLPKKRPMAQIFWVPTVFTGIKIEYLQSETSPGGSRNNGTSSDASSTQIFWVPTVLTGIKNADTPIYMVNIKSCCQQERAITKCNVAPACCLTYSTVIQFLGGC
jgi:hypothetical protein